MSLGLTPSQTVGPYLSIGLTWPDGEAVVPAGTPGAVVLRGVLYDGAGDPIPDGMIETWQADPDGRFATPEDPRGASTYAAVEDFRGYGRAHTAADGSWWLRTLKPGPVPDGDGGLQAPHVDVSVFARGLLDRVVTRLYFGDEADANAADPVLQSVAPQRRATIVAVRAERVPGAPGTAVDPGELGSPVEYVLDIHLQGEAETVFFAL